MVELKGYKVNSITFENKVENGTQLQLQNKIQYNVNYMDADNRCVSVLNFRVIDSNMNPFEIRLEIIAEFSYDAGDEKADIHTGSFDQIFPFVRQIINSVTAMSGIPGLMIPIVKLDRESVAVNNNPNDTDEESRLN